MKIVVAGASGLIGRSLVPALQASGHEVRRLVRGAATMADEILWNPAAGAFDASRLGDVDAIVNLAGENVGAGRWTAARRERIMRSRVDTTRTLVRAMATIERRPTVLLNASAIGIYGSAGDEVLTESRRVGQGFLADVCRAWEAEAELAAPFGARVVRLRFGVVLASDGGALAKMLPVFRCGLGGPVGDGRQWMSWVSLADAVRAVGYLLNDSHAAGAFNVTAPNPVTNAEFARVLGKVLRRPAVLSIPRWSLRTVVGDMADETLLASQRAVPARLSERGFRFEHETLPPALRAATV